MWLRVLEISTMKKVLNLTSVEMPSYTQFLKRSSSYIIYYPCVKKTLQSLNDSIFVCQQEMPVVQRATKQHSL